MESKNYSISEMELEPSDAKTIMTKLIDAQINTYRLQSIQDWERKRDKGDRWKNEIEKLKNFKKRLNEDLESLTNAEDILKINLSLNLDKVNHHEIRKVS